ncbi:MAG TPA: hypothetical protein VMG31_04935 [Verrucomicrobiae bacterium]|nr:hypothetical protein [Verrucomicrobiae bacterium]
MDCDEEREGYVNPVRSAYPPIHSSVGQLGKRRSHGYHFEEVLGGLLTLAGSLWALYVVFVEHASFWQIQLLPPSPVEICGLGILVLLHAKGRHATHAE